MNIEHRIQRSFKPRFAIIYPFGLIMFWYGYFTQRSLRAGIGYCIAGLLLRLWSNGYAIKNDKLTSSGPYAFVRNPLYLGTLLIALGFAIMLNIQIIGILFMLALILVYYKTIQAEQGMLTAKFGDAYRKYMSKVPAILPSLIPYPEGEKWPFSLKRLIDSKEHKALFWVIIVLVAFHVKTRLFVEHKDLTTKTWFLVGLCVILILLDILYEINKKRIHGSK